MREPKDGLVLRRKSPTSDESSDARSKENRKKSYVPARVVASETLLVAHGGQRQGF